MEPNNIETEPRRVKSILCTVTPFSKYLALLLFILMPFVGGWIGYHFALDNGVVEQVSNMVDAINSEEKVVNATTTTEIPSEMVREVNFDEVRKKYVIENPNKELEELYTPGSGDLVFYSSFTPHSSACCTTIAYDTKTATFHEIYGGYINMMIGEKSSPEGRYIAHVEDGWSVELSKSVKIITVLDLDSRLIAAEARPLRENETFVSSECGYDGYVYDLNWTNEGTLTYAVYKEGSADKCEPDLVERRELKVR